MVSREKLNIKMQNVKLVLNIVKDDPFGRAQGHPEQS